MNLKNRMKLQDLHIIVNGETQRLVTYQRDGTPIFSCPARCYGQHSDWTQPNGDTPPGLYRVGQIYDTQGEAAYGQWCLDLEDLENQETGHGRAGISLHGGGTGLPDPFAPYQGWLPTHGCIRLQNADLTCLTTLIFDARKSGGSVFLTVVYPHGKLS